MKRQQNRDTDGIDAHRYQIEHNSDAALSRLEIIVMWYIYAKCPTCSSRYIAPFGNKVHIHREVCSECGTAKSEWDLATERWVSDVVWWNPTTWGTGHWETRAT